MKDPIRDIPHTVEGWLFTIFTGVMMLGVTVMMVLTIIMIVRAMP